MFREIVEDGSVWTEKYTEYMVHFEETVKKSFWLGNEFDSTSAFINHITDFGFSFTFNPGMDFPKLMRKISMGKTFLQILLKTFARLLFFIFFHYAIEAHIHFRRWYQQSHIQ